MEIIEPREIARTADDRTVVVAHSQTGLSRGLDHGEAVILVTEDGEHHVARVTGIEFELDDTVYTIELGGRIPAELAQERAAGLDPDKHDLPLQEIIDLLHGLRRQAVARAPEWITPGLATT
jgi:hypothetical protein